MQHGDHRCVLAGLEVLRSTQWTNRFRAGNRVGQRGSVRRVDHGACAVNVALHSAHRYAQPFGDGLVTESFCHHHTDLELAFGQRQRAEYPLEDRCGGVAARVGGPCLGLQLARAVVAGRMCDRSLRERVGLVWPESTWGNSESGSVRGRWKLIT